MNFHHSLQWYLHFVAKFSNFNIRNNLYTTWKYTAEFKVSVYSDNIQSILQAEATQK